MGENKVKKQRTEASSAEPTGSAVPENRRVALRLLQAVLREKRPLDEQVDLLCRPLESRDRGFVRLLVATCLRRMGQIDTLLNRALDRPLPAKLADVRDVLRLSVAQLLFLKTPPHAVVNTSVGLVKESKLAPYSGLVNAVLRRLSRDGDALLATIDADRLNMPKWLWLDWVSAYGEATARAIGAAHQAEAPLDITLKDPSEADLWCERLSAERLPTGSLRCSSLGAVQEMDGYDEGRWWVQDAAAALPVRLLGDVRGATVLDLCAAPGGKTCQLAAAGAQVTALDRSARRLRRVQENLNRLQLTATVQDANAVDWRPEHLVDAVLLDAPCSATGTLRRHPDVARLKRSDDLASLIGVQSALLASAVEMVKVGGMVIYCTCSLQRSEGEDQIAHALAAGLPYERVPLTVAELQSVLGLSAEDAAGMLTAEGDLRTLPCHWSERGGLDGFFAARLRRLR